MDQPSHQPELTPALLADGEESFCHRVLERMIKAMRLDAAKLARIMIRVNEEDDDIAMCVRTKLSVGVFLPRPVFQDGQVLGEELGHALHGAFQIGMNIHATPQQSSTLSASQQLRERLLGEKQAGEFIGFVCRRVLFELLTKDEQKFLFSDGPPKNPFEDAKHRMIKKEELRTHRRKIKKLQRFSAQDLQSSRVHKSLKANIFAEEYERICLIGHCRGYRFGNSVALDRIGNFADLFSMTNKEIIRRYFRENPEY